MKYHFKIDNRSYDEMKRVGAVLLISVTHDNGRILGYEVVTLKKHPAEVIKGTAYPERESYPKNEDFGEYGQYFQRLENAMNLYNSLTERPIPVYLSRNAGHLKLNRYVGIPRTLSGPKKSTPLKRKRTKSFPGRLIDTALI
jgi:hypothetical protein